MPDVAGLGPREAGGTALTYKAPVQFTELPESFLDQLCKRLPQEDIKSLRLVCPRLCTLCNVTNKLTSLKASALLSGAAPTLACLPPITFLDFNARNAACSHQLLAALRQHGTRLEQSLVHLCDSLLGLRALSIRGLAHALTSESLAHLHRLTQLVSLSVDHLKLQTGCSLPCGSQLRSLELSDATISGPSFASLNALVGLQSLSVWGTGHPAALAFAPLTGLTTLRRLHLELPLDGEVLEGLRGCTALASLSVPSARVLRWGAGAASPEEGSDEGCYGADLVGVSGLSGGGSLPPPPPPQLTSVTRLSLEAWSEDCLPLAAWLPGLRSLVLEDGEGMWNAVAGHEQLTAIRAAAGGSLPSAGGAGGGGDCCGGALGRLPPQLASLRLGGCQDLPEQHYLSCAPLPALTTCELSGCGALTTGALLGLLAAMPVLRELSLEGAPYVTDAALAELGAVGDGEVWGSGAGAGVAEDLGVVSVDGDGGGGLGIAAPLSVACGPAVAAAAKAAVLATGVPVPPCNACAGIVVEPAVPRREGVAASVAAPAGPAAAADGEALPGAATPQVLGTGLVSGGAIPRSSSAAALAAVMKGLGQDSLAAAAARAVATLGAVSRSHAGGSSTSGAAAALRRLELTRLSSITARGIAAAAAGLPRLTELRISSCQAVCREACVWLPQHLGRPYLSVVCSHAAVYDDP
ncbi:hypothetical protein VOLCADRAFT_99728 [Volvox carteri f. nagariensis]|uniref:F-box domain-containing protein n=1 Tax=Volvox carteri f. nagariensis TaxID=3068 RepID=D8UIH6_VOLCA|nr:uncharacterized protein VOLCADRAFT_99728 [Volvox carteri f. nagariensis]EFJ40454.1 hypothetical protein VOLCADRAFT_99728 [Volvox carteri f. nagariensis]|eukprot:XP_002958454.1 hypothetical protein VOLCADRAFT_99728 [Volvox carteri f. nagariensis]